MTLAAPQLVTAENLLEIVEDERDYEIVDGVLTEVPPVGAYEAKLEFILAYLLKVFTSEHHIAGEILPATARFRLQRDPDIVRGPDVSFISSNRLPPGPLPSTYLDLAPNLAAEIVSKSNTAEEIERKIVDYRQAGVEMIWVIYPETRTACLYTSDEQFQRIDASGNLDGGQALPGFQLKLADLFEEAERND